MPEFLSLQTPNEALNLLLQRIQIHIVSEEIATETALGRVTAQPILSPFPLPSFSRSAVDGYAVRAQDTFGASDSLPAYLRLIGEIPMGTESRFSIGLAECCLVHTGGMLPDGSDSVVMLEQTQIVSSDEVEILRPVATNENVLLKGEDVKDGELVIPAGVRLRPAEIGGLMALGQVAVRVVKKPIVAIISTGDEVVAPSDELTPGKVHDINSYSLSALIEASGAIPVRYGIVPDKLETLQSVAKQALQECDLVVITAGSSASSRDLTAEVINNLGQPGVLVHGVNIRPGKPTILAVCEGKAIIGLPGNPVSALVIASLFLVPTIKFLLGDRDSKPNPYIEAKLTVNIPSQTGREDWIPVEIIQTEEGNFANPLFSKSNLIFSLSRADGLISIPPASTGLDSGAIVHVYLMRF